jgi:hypothetical protein
MRPSTFAILTAALTVCVGAVPAVTAATITNTVATGNDDVTAWGPTTQNWTINSAVAGTDSTNVAPYYLAAFRFSGVALTQKTTIVHAYLRVQAYLPGTGSSSLDIAAEAYDSPNAYNYVPYAAQRALTTARAAWSIPSAWAEDGVYDSPDLKNVVQEIVNRSGWSSGNALAIQLRNAVTSGGCQQIYTLESAPTYGASAARLIIEYAGSAPSDGVKSSNSIPGAASSPSLLPTYLNNPSMYDPAASGGLCWATANGDIFAYWDRNTYTNGVQYWNLADNGTAPLLQPSLPAAPGHSQGNIQAAITWLATKYYNEGNGDEKAVLETWANTTNGLAFSVTYHGPVSTTADRTTLFGVIKGEIDAGRPISIGSWGTYFGGAHQIPVMGYIEMSNAVNSVVYIHRNTGGTESEYVSIYASTWGNLDMDQIIPGGTPVDEYEAQGDNTSATAVALDPDSVYGFRQTHNFSYAGDPDWVKITCVSGKQYTITTSSLGTNCNTVLSLLRSNGVTQIAQDDDGGGEARASRINWNCWSNGLYLVRLTDKVSGYGPAANYDLTVQYATATNHAPTNLVLGGSLSVLEQQPAGTPLGLFTAQDPDTGDTFTNTLVSGTGSTDNGLFAISGSSLVTATGIVYDSKSSCSIRVRTTDQSGLWYEKVFTIAVLDLQMPFVDVTNVNATVANAVTAQAVGGTNNAHVAGTMRWTNSLSGGSGTFAAGTPWTTPSIGLSVGTNVITVYGTNALGTQAWDSVSITRSAITYWTLTVTGTGSGTVNPAGSSQLTVGAGTTVVATAAEWNRILSITTNGVAIAAAAERKCYTNTVAPMAANQTNATVVTFHALSTQLVSGVSNSWVSGYYATESAAQADVNLAMDYLLNIVPTSGDYVPTLQITALTLTPTSLAFGAQLKTNGTPRDTNIQGYFLLQGSTNAAGPYTNLLLSAMPNAVFTGGGRATNTIPRPASTCLYYRVAVTNAL